MQDRMTASLLRAHLQQNFHPGKFEPTERCFFVVLVTKLESPLKSAKPGLTVAAILAGAAVTDGETFRPELKLLNMAM
jgi:hypothetical protein